MSEWRIFGDWGTTRLRLWRVLAGCVTDRLDGPGIGARDGFAAEALRTAMAPWVAEHGMPSCVTLCGMAGARNGLREVPYVECPAGERDWCAGATQDMFDGVALRVAAGCASARDIMRGEETQVFGALARDRLLARGRQLMVLPGTHSKWVWLEDGRILGLRSFMTGELYALLQQSSLFATGSSDDTPGDGFVDGLALARSGSGALGELFQPRIAQLRRGRSAGWARAQLSGLLIGSEVQEMLAAGALPNAISLIGAPGLAGGYAKALAGFGVAVNALSGDDCVLSGLELLDADY